jgi:hypothetical protein
MNQVLKALDEENDRLYGDSKRNDRYDRSDSVMYPVYPGMK